MKISVKVCENFVQGQPSPLSTPPPPDSRVPGGSDNFGKVETHLPAAAALRIRVRIGICLLPSFNSNGHMWISHYIVFKIKEGGPEVANG